MYNDTKRWADANRNARFIWEGIFLTVIGYSRQDIIFLVEGKWHNALPMPSSSVLFLMNTDAVFMTFGAGAFDTTKVAFGSVSFAERLWPAPIKAVSKVDMSRFPHVCTRCKKSCYEGAYALEHADGKSCSR